MSAVPRVLVAGLVVAALVACIPGLGDCDMKPLGALPLAAIGPPGPPAAGPPAASCASMVEFDGRRYYRSGDTDSWTVEIDDLEPIGVASAANEPAWKDTTVFAISGVDAQDAIAMQYGSGVTIAVLLAGELPGDLCPFLAAPEHEPTCPEGE